MYESSLNSNMSNHKLYIYIFEANSSKLCFEIEVNPHIYDQGGLKSASPKSTGRHL